MGEDMQCALIREVGKCFWGEKRLKLPKIYMGSYIYTYLLQIYNIAITAIPGFTILGS